MELRRDQDARVVTREELSPTCFRIELAVAAMIAAAPGQFAMLTCTPGLDPLLRRAFSIAATHGDGTGGRVELLVKEVGRGTASLRRAAVGTVLRMLAPLGNSFTLAAAADERLALVAGGIGLPPVLAAAERLAERGTAFDLFLGATTAVELLLVDRCREATAVVGGELVLSTDDGSRGESGLVTAALGRRLAAGRRYRRALACGPEAMLRALARLAADAELPLEVSLEEPMGCGMGVCLGCVVELADGRLVPSCTEGPVFASDRLAAGWRS